MDAVGIHVFAGGFSHGVQRVFNVKTHLETHGFGLETAKELCKVNIHNTSAKDWPHVDASFAFGNPRCTGFSTITSGYDTSVHGPFAAATIDIVEFMDYCTGRYPIFAWESVQQAISVGRPLLDKLVEQVKEQGYRVAHVLVNSASFGNAQHRKRYFFVAYKGNKNFNVDPPTLPEYMTTVYDAIWHLQDDDSPTVRLTPDEKHVVPNLPNGWDMNLFAAYNFDLLPDRYKDAWLLTNSNMPFSLHCIKRLNWCTKSPTLHSSCDRLIHPDKDRPLTIKELATIAGWPIVPVGKNPMQELAKGVCPCVGEWIAIQAYHYLNDAWGDADYESTYNHKTGVWEGQDCNGATEKTFNLTNYIPQKIRQDYPYDVFRRHRHNVDQDTGRPIRTWSSIAEQSRQHNTVDWVRSTSKLDQADLLDE